MSRNQRRLMDQRYPVQRYQNDRSSVNPWEGGFAPGGGSGLLPTPSTSNILSQLSSPEAQLAVASNLLSSLLRPVTNNFQQGQLPALMGLGSSSSNYGSSYGNSQQYNDNYPSRGGGGGGGGFDDYHSGPGNHRRSFESFRSRSPVRNAPPKRGQQSNRGRQAGSQSKTKMSSDQHQQNQQQKDGKRDFGNRKDTTSKEAEKKGATFEGLPKAAFHCHVCKKDMWDAKSFDNHVKGMAHQKMLAEREKGYMVKAQLLRHEAKLEEQQNEIELERLIRLGKKTVPNRREFCKMCDFAFFGEIAIHRKSKIHQQLKSFLHPKCTNCHEEFSLRIDMDRHLVSATHLKNVFKDKLKGKSESEKKEGNEDGKTGDGEGEKSAAAGNGMTEEGAEKVQDDDVEMREEDAEKPEEKPEEKPAVYDPDVSVGEEFMLAVTGIFCKVCRRFFLADDPNLASHCRSAGHFNNVAAAKQIAAEAEAASKAEEKKKETSDVKEEKAEESDVQVFGKREPSLDLTRETKRPKQDEIYDPTEVDNQEEQQEAEKEEEIAEKEEEIAEKEEEIAEKEEEMDKQEAADTEEEQSKMQELDQNIDELEAIVKEDNEPEPISPAKNVGRARRARPTQRRGRY